jgi:hypothetical protein
VALVKVPFADAETVGLADATDDNQAGSVCDALAMLGEQGEGIHTAKTVDSRVIVLVTTMPQPVAVGSAGSTGSATALTAAEEALGLAMVTVLTRVVWRVTVGSAGSAGSAGSTGLATAVAVGIGMVTVTTPVVLMVVVTTLLEDPLPWV